MTHPHSDFRVAFVDFFKKTGRLRDVEPEALLARWEEFVDKCERGYPNDAQDYTNELTARDSLEQAMESEELQVFPELSKLCARVEVADARFRPMLIPDVFPRMDRKLWWARGMVRYGRKRLVESLRREYGIEIDEME